jgi:hypothetical protein
MRLNSAGAMLRIVLLAGCMVVASALIIPGQAAAASFPTVELSNGATLPGGGTFNLPMPTGSGGIAAGDLLIVTIAHDGNGGPGACETGWEFVTSSANYVIICARIAVGSETQYPAFSNPSGLIAGQSFRVVGWVGGVINAGTISATAFRGTGSANPNPPSHDPAGWAIEETLWLAGGAMSNNGQAWDITTPPTDFTLIRYDDGTQQSIASAYRKQLVGSMDPGTFGVTGTGNSWQAWTIAIRPSATAPLVTLPASGISHNSAVLNGRLDVLHSSTVTLRFDYGPTASLGSETGSVTEDATGEYEIRVTGLSPETTYFFRAYSEEVPSGHNATGATLNFTTVEFPPIIAQAFSAFWIAVFGFVCIMMVIGAWKIRQRLHE